MFFYFLKLHRTECLIPYREEEKYRVNHEMNHVIKYSPQVMQTGNPMHGRRNDLEKKGMKMFGWHISEHISIVTCWKTLAE